MNNVTMSFCFLTRCIFFIYFAADVLRLEIVLYSGKNSLLDMKALLLLLDDKSLSRPLDDSTRKMFNLLNERYVSTLLARRCKVSCVDTLIILLLQVT